MAMTIRSPAFEHNQRIPTRYTGDGEDVSPPLEWSGVPAGTQELALIMDDPDAPRPEPWVHWVIYKIPASIGGLPEGMPKQEQLDTPPGAVQGRNTWDLIGYGGPAPPKGHGVHHYHFKLYALSAPVDLNAATTKELLLEAMQGGIAEESELIGTYER